MNPDTRVSRRCIDAVEFRGRWPEAIGFDGVEPAFLGMSRRRVRCAPWWKNAGIDPVKAAQKLWNDSRMDSGVDSAGADGATSRGRSNN